MTALKTKLEKTVVRPIFASVHPNGHRNQSLPDVVFENRWSRAYSRVLDALISRGAPTVPAALRTRLESMVEAWNTAVFDDAFQPIQQFEIDCAREREVLAAEKSGDPKRKLEILEQQYRRDIEQRFGTIELRGVQVNHRVILELNEVYVPLHFVTGTLPPKRIPLDDMVRENQRILIIGSPGSGKSTLLSYLAKRYASDIRELPIVVVVRELGDANLIPASPVVQTALSQNRTVLLVDGLDEAPEDIRTALLKAIVQFTSNYPKAPVIVTSRPAGSPGEIDSCLPGFNVFRLADLESKEVGEFIDKWCLAADRSARSGQSDVEDQARIAATDLKSRIARSRPVERLAVNPLLITILCVVHRFLGRTIPEHRITLYEKCTDALLYEWDRAKFQKDSAIGELDANQKRALLRGVASAMHEKHEAEMAEADVVRHFAEVLPGIGKPKEDALKIVREIRDRTGLLVERRPGVFAFSHLTFQEYFTALDYAARPQELLEHVNEHWWHEVIALAAGVQSSDPIRIIQPLLKGKNRDRIILSAKCLETAVHAPFGLRRRVETAVEKILPPRSHIDVVSLVEIGMSVAPILARNLPSYDAEGREYSLLFFLCFEYAPVIPILLQLASDEQPMLESDFSTIGEFSIFILGWMARTSEMAKRAFTSVLSRPLSEEFIKFLKRKRLLDADFKPSRPGKRSPKPSRSTASALSSKPR